MKWTWIRMYRKFVITADGLLKFGTVHMHKDLLDFGEECEYGGGMWQIDSSRGVVALYGSSYDFGNPDLDMVRRVDWSGLGGTPRPLIYFPNWPDEIGMRPLYF